MKSKSKSHDGVSDLTDSELRIPQLLLNLLNLGFIFLSFLIPSCLHFFSKLFNFINTVFNEQFKTLT